MHAETPSFDKTMNYNVCIYSIGVFFQNGVENSNSSYFANTCICVYMLLHNENECHSLLSFPDNCCIVEVTHINIDSKLHIQFHSK